VSFESKPTEFSKSYRPIAYSVDEIAEMLDVPKSTIYREIREGRLIARRVGKFYRVHADRFDEYLKGPDPVSQPDYMNVQIPVSGLSATGERYKHRPSRPKHAPVGRSGAREISD
jgi:excisionase family DNA binding protein